MTTFSLTTHADGLISLTGDLTFATISKKTVQLLDFKKITSEATIDFAEVKQSDSAGLALLIEWLKISKAVQKPIRFKNIPPQLLTLAKLSGFDITTHSF